MSLSSFRQIVRLVFLIAAFAAGYIGLAMWLNTGPFRNKPDARTSEPA